MAAIDLHYGRRSVSFDIDPSRLRVLDLPAELSPLTDVEIGKALDSPIGTPPLEDIISPGESVLFVVPDATRQAGVGQIVNLLTRRLIANGTTPAEMAIIFATGIHRKVTDMERADILTSFVAQRIKTLDHDPRDLASLVRLGETRGGIPIELNRAVRDYDRVVLIGGVTFHYFAGFTGGRKLICPGLGSSRTISATHKLAFDCEKRSRREGVGTALLEGNAVHEAFIEIVSKAAPSFAINTIVGGEGATVEVYCGDWLDSHRIACDSFATRHTIRIHEKRQFVIVSCGGWPYDINMIQAHKSLEAASHACIDGGTIVLLAECRDGLGRDDFLNWFAARDSSELAIELCKKYQVNGQTAWSLLRKAEKFDLRIVTDLPDELCSGMRMKRIPLADAQALVSATRSGYLIPNGAKILLSLEEPATT